MMTALQSATARFAFWITDTDLIQEPLHRLGANG